VTRRVCVRVCVRGCVREAVRSKGLKTTNRWDGREIDERQADFMLGRKPVIEAADVI
jgi:hypothetical protein